MKAVLPVSGSTETSRAKEQSDTERRRPDRDQYHAGCVVSQLEPRRRSSAIPDRKQTEDRAQLDPGSDRIFVGEILRHELLIDQHGFHTGCTVRVRVT